MVGGPHYYHRIDTPLRDNGMKDAAPDPPQMARCPRTLGGLKSDRPGTTDGYELNLEDGGWLPGPLLGD